MDNSQAKQLLRAHRAEIPDPSPEMAEALELAKRDPALKKWANEQLHFNQVMSARLKSIPVPSALQAQILAARQPVIPLWRRHLPKYAAVAALIALLGVVMVWIPGARDQKTLAGFQSRMVGFALREYRMDIVSEDAQAIREFLKKRSAPNYTLPPAIQALRPMGGARLSWQGRPVGMLCYKLPNNQTAYLFVLQESGISRGSELGPTPQFQPAKGLNTASWKANDTIYFLAAPLSEKELENLVQGLAAQYEAVGGASTMLVRSINHLKSAASL